MKHTPLPVVLITGAARRVGAVVAKYLHQKGFNIALHFHHSQAQATRIIKEFNQKRPHSALGLQADLLDHVQLPKLIQNTISHFGHLNVLINNASTFYPTPIEKATTAQWHDLIGSNVQAPFFLCQAAMPALKKSQGSIINIVDIHGQSPLANYPIYCIAKAGLLMLTKSLAKELAPDIRVNGIAPGPIIWPEGKNKLSLKAKAKIINDTALKRIGNPEDIAKSAYFLIADAPYITGQILAVDGGRLL